MLTKEQIENSEHFVENYMGVDIFHKHKDGKYSTEEFVVFNHRGVDVKRRVNETDTAKLKHNIRALKNHLNNKADYIISKSSESCFKIYIDRVIGEYLSLSEDKFAYITRDYSSSNYNRNYLFYVNMDEYNKLVSVQVGCENKVDEILSKCSMISKSDRELFKLYKTAESLHIDTTNCENSTSVIICKFFDILFPMRVFTNRPIIVNRSEQNVVDIINDDRICDIIAVYEMSNDLYEEFVSVREKYLAEIDELFDSFRKVLNVDSGKYVESKVEIEQDAGQISEDAKIQICNIPVLIAANEPKEKKISFIKKIKMLFVRKM